MAEKRTRRSFTREFKAQAVKRLLEGGRGLSEVAAELGLSTGQVSTRRSGRRGAVGGGDRAGLGQGAAEPLGGRAAGGRLGRGAGGPQGRGSGGAAAQTR